MHEMCAYICGRMWGIVSSNYINVRVAGCGVEF